MEDMVEYDVEWSDPVRFIYRGREILGSPPPNDGGLVIGYNLNVLEIFDLKSSGSYMESARTLEPMTRVFGRVQSEVVAGGRAGQPPTAFIRDPLDYNIPSDV